MAIEILYRDETAVAVHKPGGMLVHRTREAVDADEWLLQLVRREVGKRVYPVHRLDRAASGVILFALSSDDTRRWQEALKAPETAKTYVAVVRGTCPEGWCMDRPLTSDRGVPREARTSFERIATFEGLSLVRVRLHTGRRHQIRRHLAHSAHQIVGDSTYGKGRINRYLREERGLPRMFLHASSLEVDHPATGERIRIDCPLSEDLRRFLAGFDGLDPAVLAKL